jgi:hypothetical protein
LIYDLLCKAVGTGEEFELVDPFRLSMWEADVKTMSALK